MADNSQDTLIRAFTTLSSLRKNIDQMDYGVQDTYMHEYHTVLDRLENIGMDISEFRIPDSEVKPRVTSISYRGRTYSEEKYVNKPFILTKLDAILGYFEIITSEKPRKMGFTK